MSPTNVPIMIGDNTNMHIIIVSRLKCLFIRLFSIISNLTEINGRFYFYVDSLVKAISTLKTHLILIESMCLFMLEKYQYKQNKPISIFPIP